MAIHAVDKTFTQFLDPETTVYIIPTYQRVYSWKTDHCAELLNDIIENDSGYFIGSIIWIKDTHEIIDGQQRLTSLNLLLLAILHKLNSFPEDRDLIIEKADVEKMIVNKGKNRLVPQNQGKNKEDFEYLILSNCLKQPCAKPNNFGNRRVGKNYSFFEETIANYSLEETEELFNKIKSLTFISAQVDDVQTAFTLFETMNNRGMELSAIDLIKNSYISKTNDTKEWENLVSILGNENNQEQFLRNNYNAFRKEYNKIRDVVTEDTKYDLAAKATKSNVIKIYSLLVDREDFMDFLKLNAKYNSLLTGEENPQIEINEKIKEYFKKFRTANATSAFMLLLYLLRNQTPFGITEDQMINLLDLILRFFIRRNLTNKPSTGALPQILMNIIAEINKMAKPKFGEIRNIILTEFVSKSSSDATVTEVLNGDIYETNRDMARYLLCSLCSFDDNNERRFIDLWEKDENNRYIWTIEHILPEGNKDASNIPQCWIDMIKNENMEYNNLSNERVIDMVRKYRHKIGNLTMTGYNSNLGNKSFDIKKNSVDKKKNPIGFNNGLSLNDYVYNQNAWYIGNIKERTKMIVNKILNNLSLK